MKPMHLNKSTYTALLLDGYCVKSSHSITSSVIYSNTLKIRRTLFINDAYQYLYPDLVFSCNGTIGKWIFGARPGEDDESQLPEFQIWRQVGPVRYVKAASSLARGSTKIGTNLYQFTPQAPLLFKEGEMFGIFVPSRDNARIVLYEQEASGPTNLRISANRALSTREGALSTVAYNDFPLVTAEYSQYMLIGYYFFTIFKLRYYTRGYYIKCISCSELEYTSIT